MNPENHETPTLKTLRESVGLTQPELSRRLSVSIRSVTAWERGEYVPAFDRAIALAAELGVSLKTLARSMQLDVTGVPDDQELPPAPPSPRKTQKASMTIPKDDSLG